MWNQISSLYSSPLKINLHSNVYGLARTLLAASTLLTLLFNDTSIIFTETTGVQPPICLGISKASIYCLLNSNLEIARFISIGVLVVIISGWRPQVTGILHWWVTFSLNSTALLLDGGDQVATVLTFLLIPICLTDKRKWHWSAPIFKNEISDAQGILNFMNYSTYFIIRIQIALIYFTAAVEKFKVEEWMNGTAIYYWVINPYMGANSTVKFLLYPLVTNTYITPIITWSAILLELILFLGLVISTKYRSSLLLAGILFHLAIAFLHGLFPFLFSMSGALVLYLGPLNKNYDFTIVKKTLKRKVKLEQVKP